MIKKLSVLLLVLGVTTAFTQAAKEAVNEGKPDKYLRDFDGNYTSTGVGMTLAAGRSTVAMKNQHGVKVAVYSISRGLDVTIGGAGVEMRIKK